jgi:hypothetical protein
LAYLSWNSGAAFATHGIAIVAPAAVPARSTERRVVLSVILIPPIDFRLYARPSVLIMAGATRTASGAALTNRGRTVHGESDARPPQW